MGTSSRHRTCCARVTKLFTLLGANSGCRHKTMFPLAVVIVAWYSLAGLMVSGGAAGYSEHLPEHPSGWRLRRTSLSNS